MPLSDDFRAESRKRWDEQAAGWESRRDAVRTATMPVSAWMVDAIDPQPGQTVLELAAWAGPEENPWSVLPMRELVARGLIEAPDPDAPGQFTWGRPGLVAEHLQAAGFAEHHVEALDFEIPYASVDDWWDAQLALSSRFAGAIAAAAPDVAADVRAAVERDAEQFARAGGGLRVPARSWVAWATA